MHTALECEVTIKPRFVYIPSPRTGPMRSGDCESRDGAGGSGEGVERETRSWESWLGDPRGSGRWSSCSCCNRLRWRAGAKRVGQRVGNRGSSCALRAALGLATGQPLPRVRDPLPDLGSCGGWERHGERGSDRWASGG